MSLTIRLRSKEGNSRLQLTQHTSGEELAEQILDTLPDDVDSESVTISNSPGSSGEKIRLGGLHGRTVNDMGFKNGELLFVDFQLEGAAPKPSSSGAAAPFAAPATGREKAEQATRPKVDLSKVQEEEVDVFYKTQPGMIPRERDGKMCRHGDKGMCDYCMPLEPYDSTYHATNKIKHLSFPSYLRKLTGSLSASKTATSSSLIPPLSPLNFNVVTPCPSASHAPWPAGICSKCQPSAITLQSQEFRMVDHVEFSSPNLVDGFLQGWRKTGTQRFGFLLGRWEAYEGVPMGVKAVVEAVHELEQEGEVDGVTVKLPWEEEERVQRLAGWCKKGLQVVGMVYTDLTASPEDITRTLYKRHPQSYYLSSLELLLSAQLQLSHPLPTRASPTGEFGSRFVTCVLTGDKDGGVDVMAFQASEQAVAMVAADMIEASVEPGTVRVKKEGAGRYIPDVFYTFKNEYALQVKQSAKPCFPVEYLLVNITHGFPVTPQPLFPTSNFPVSNRPTSSSTSAPSMGKVVSSLLPIVGDGTYTSESDKVAQITKWAGDWHLLEYLQREGGFEEEEMKLLATVATGGDGNAEARDQALAKLVQSPGWLTLMGIVKAAGEAQAAHQVAERMDREERMAASGGGGGGGGGGDDEFDFANIPDEDAPPGGGDAGGGGGGGLRVCPHCTFENDHGGDCDICGLPLDG